jgi:hypothetical protein
MCEDFGQQCVEPTPLTVLSVTMHFLFYFPICVVSGDLWQTEGALPDTYGFSMEQLADTMNAMREEAIRNLG